MRNFFTHREDAEENRDMGQENYANWDGEYETSEEYYEEAAEYEPSGEYYESGVDDGSAAEYEATGEYYEEEAEYEPSEGYYEPGLEEESGADYEASGEYYEEEAEYEPSEEYYESGLEEENGTDYEATEEYYGEAAEYEPSEEYYGSGVEDGGQYEADGEYYEESVEYEEASGEYYEEEIEYYEDETYNGGAYEDEFYEDGSDERAPVGVFAWFAGMTVMDKVMLGAGVCVLLLAVVTGILFLRTRSSASRLPVLASVGEQIEGIEIVGDKGLLAVADATLAKQEAIKLLEPGQDNDNTYHEIDYQKNVTVTLKMVSVQKDLKIKFVDKGTDKLIPNVPFSVTITTPEGRAEIWADDDMDGIIYKKGITPGNYKVTVDA